MIASPNLRNGIPQEPRFSTAGETGLFNHSVPPSERKLNPFVFYQLWLFIAPGLYRKEKTLRSAVLTQYGWFIHSRRFVWLQNGLPGVPGLLNHDYLRLA